MRAGSPQFCVFVEDLTTLRASSLDLSTTNKRRQDMPWPFDSARHFLAGWADVPSLFSISLRLVTVRWLYPGAWWEGPSLEQWWPPPASLR